MQLGLSQVPEWYWSGGQRFQQRENSLELALAGGHDVGRAIHGTVSADAAVVLAASLGCTVGEFSNNYGDAGCVNSFARDGSVRAGLRLRLIDTWTTARARPYAGVSVSGGTIAAGRGVSFGLFAGVAIPYFR
ncbi:MAG: hypothetical protein HY084_10615 [Gemmatimonadetes bacterium]|nr:hypothetical protein [Gemmatimonadota bacterium]